MLLKNFKQTVFYDLYANPRSYSFSLSLVFLSALIMIFSPDSTDLLRYHSVEVSKGEFWRLLTGNLCHSNWNHWLLNTAGLILIDLFYKPVIKQKIRGLLLMCSMLVCVLSLHLLMQVEWYVGLSGALHGYLIGGALISWKSAKKINFGIILVVTSKLIAEQTWQINDSTAALIGANVLEESHMYGAIGGAIFALAYRILLKRTAKRL